jgi:hypothetical protein
MPETTDYMIYGYVAGLSCVALLTLSIFWRWRSLRADEAALERLEQEIAKEGIARPSEPSNKTTLTQDAANL